jgi:hypothetical protein
MYILVDLEGYKSEYEGGEFHTEQDTFERSCGHDESGMYQLKVEVNWL